MRHPDRHQPRPAPRQAEQIAGASVLTADCQHRLLLQGRAGVFTDQSRIGVLWYAKPGLTKGMPAALLAFHERNPSYPRIGTLDQFFDTATFVAYRNLGRYNAREMLMARRKLTEALATLIAIGDSQTLDDMLTELADAHWVVEELARAARGAAGSDPQVRADKVAAYCRAVRASLVG